jgi:sugar transferase (PEP-CTERM/EpsH1 system associated)
MNILVLSPDFPYPPDTGTSLITYHHLTYLARRHSVDLLSLSRRPVAEFGPLAGVCRHVQVVPLPPRRSWRERLRGFWDWRPWQLLAYFSPTMKAIVADRLVTTDYDVVLVLLTPMAQYVPVEYGGATVWLLEDPPVRTNARSLSYQRLGGRMRTRERMWRLKRFERAVAHRYDRVLVINRQDAEDYSELLPRAHMDWVPYAVDFEAFAPDPSVVRKGGRIVISGNMNHPPNVDAVRWFTREVFPLVRAAVPTAELWCVGASPVPAVQALAADRAIHVTGRVDDIRPYLREAMVSVCAVRLRIGTQTKVLEAMACGTPVVTTSAGNHGVGAESGEGLYVADDPADMARCVVALLRGERWEAMSAAARRFVLANFTWERSGRRLEEILVEAMAAAASRKIS